MTNSTAPIQIIEGDNRSKVDQPILGHVCLDQVTLGYTRRNVPDIFTSLSLGSEVGTDASDDGDSLADNSPAPVGMLTCVIIDRYELGGRVVRVLQYICKCIKIDSISVNLVKLSETDYYFSLQKQKEGRPWPGTSEGTW